MKFDMERHTIDHEDETYTPGFVSCESCGYERYDPGISDGPVGCPKCGNIPNLNILGIGSLSIEQLGKKLGKYSWCDNCEELTLNVPGNTYCSKPFSEDKTIAHEKDPAKRFFACDKCGHEKFWRWNYSCDLCDCDDHYVLEVTEERYNYAASMECVGSAYDWEELWKCKVCGLEYWISNSNC